MPIPSQPTTNISLGPTLSPTGRSIASEFGDPAPHSMSEFYRGGPRIANHPINANIPTSSTGPKSFSQFNGGSIVLKYVISSPVQSLNLYEYASSPQRPSAQNISQGYDQEKKYTAYQPGFGVEFVINPGVVVGSASRTQSAITTGADSPFSWHPTVQIVVINQGQVIGAGGGGGKDTPPTTAPVGPAIPGQSGGTAFTAERPVYIQNVGSFIGGGGGGGSGERIREEIPNPKGPTVNLVAGGGGGGGVGSTGGAAGFATFSAITGPVNVPVPQRTKPATDGTAGTTTTAGTGGTGLISSPAVGLHPYYGGDGGAGGALATPGSAGTSAFLRTPIPTNVNVPYGGAGAGGANGYYVIGNPFITWQQTGTRQGQVS
jgi:hypothetical protein